MKTFNWILPVWGISLVFLWSTVESLLYSGLEKLYLFHTVTLLLLCRYSIEFQPEFMLHSKQVSKIWRTDFFPPQLNKSLGLNTQVSLIIFV